jgi:hypothetical protein
MSSPDPGFQRRPPGVVLRIAVLVGALLFYSAIATWAFLIAAFADFSHAKGEAECCITATTHYLAFTLAAIGLGFVGLIWWGIRWIAQALRKG